MKWSTLLLVAAATVAWGAEVPKELPKSDGIQEKSGLDDDDLLKAESQDAEHKQLYQHIHSGHFPQHDELGVPVSLPLPISRPGALLPSLHHAQKQPPPPPQPVYPGLNAAHSHVIENAVEYGPEVGGQPQPQPAATAVQPSPYQVNTAGQGQGQVSGNQNELWPLPTPDTPKIVHLDVKCEKNLMKVAVEFDKPFNGIIFSKGHYSQGNCVHLPAGSGKGSVYFDISINSCGTTGNTQNGLYGYGAQSGSGTFFENTIVIQYDQQVQEVWDQARKLRCTWHDQYEKSVTFRPFPVDMLDVVRADFAGDNVGCWMQIQVGKGPWASEVAGIVKIGQTMTIVLAIKDEENKFDMLVRNCIAHDGKRAPIELVDSQGCIVRPKLMSKFTKIKNFGSSASVLSYAHFQAFKFPDSMEVHFQCTIQICRYQCPEQCSQSSGALPPADNNGDQFIQASNIFHTVVKPREERKKRDVAEQHLSYEVNEIGMNKLIQVVSTGDLAFALDGAPEALPIEEELTARVESDLICMSTLSFTSASLVLTALLVAACLVAVFACMRSSRRHHVCRAMASHDTAKSYVRNMLASSSIARP